MTAPSLTPNAALVLRALARYLPPGEVFSALDVRSWMRDHSIALAVISAALTALQGYGAVKGAGRSAVGDQPLQFWRLTPRGADLCQRMREARRHAPRPARSRRRPPKNSLAMRLWSLLLVRRSLTAAEAAEVLTDASQGADAFARCRRTLASYLNRWTRRAPKTLAARREQGARRFVLLKDSVALPPICH